MSFEQISKTIYSDISFRKNEDCLHLLENHFQSFFNQLNLKSDKSLLSAFVHKSFKNENTLEIKHNETLEFFGDSVLQLIVSHILFVGFPHLSEGELSKFRSQLVNENSLSELASLMKLQDWILLGRGELKENGHLKPSLLSDTFEALLGAIYLQGGIEKSHEFFNFCMKSFEQSRKKSFVEFVKENSKDSKSALQELIMKKYKKIPTYKSIEQRLNGVDGFEVSLWMDDKFLKKEFNSSKKKAMQNLAKNVLKENLI